MLRFFQNEYKTFLTNLYLNTTHPQKIIPWFKLMNIKVDDLMSIVNAKYKIDEKKLKPYQIDLRELITNSSFASSRNG